MNILLITETFFPGFKGGTEVYVKNFASALKYSGNKVIVACLKSDVNSHKYLYEEIDVLQIQLEAKSEIISKFRNLIQAEKIQVVHIQGFNGLLDSDIIVGLSKESLPIFYTPHLLNNFCKNNGSLRYKNEKECSGKVEIAKCQSCIFHNTSLPSLYASYSFNFFLHNVLPRKLTTNILSDSHFQIDKVKEQIKIINQHKVVVIAFHGWIEKMLKINGVKNIIKIPQGVEETFISFKNLQNNERSEKHFTWAYVGRISREKGIEDLLKAFESVAKYDDRLLIVSNINKDKDTFQQDILRMIESDSRIELHQNLSGQKLVDVIDKCDCLVIPSRITETGPLVLIEALSRRKPVLVSDFVNIDVESNGIGLKFKYDHASDFITKMKKIKMEVLNSIYNFKYNTIQSYTYTDVAQLHLQQYQLCLQEKK